MGWVTLKNGRHIYIQDGEHPMNAFIKQKGGAKEKTTQELLNEATAERAKYTRKAKDIYYKLENEYREKSKLEEYTSEYYEEEEKYINSNKEYKEALAKEQELMKKEDKLYKKRDKESILKNKKISSEKEQIAKEMSDSYKFNNNELKDTVDYSISYDDKVVPKTYAIMELDKVLKKENLALSESPYSFSLYGIEKGEHIDWDYKPDKSYRLSDHWNFESRGEIHCKLENTREYNQDLILAQYNAKTGKYKVVKNFSKIQTQREMYKEYLKLHPNSKMKFNDFRDLL